MQARAPLWVTWLLGMAGMASAAAPDGPERPPADLADWSLHCFCLGAERSPHAAVGMDNNGVILHRARSGVTREELARDGIQVTDSQIELMRLMGIITIEGDVLTTAFPVVGPEQLDRLRPRLRSLAGALLPDITADVAAIRRQLGKRELSGSEYAVVFGHAVDGVLWQHLRKRGSLPPTELNVHHPFWRGAFWALYPQRGIVAGVNEHEAGDATLILTWTRPTARALYALDTSPELPGALQQLAAGHDAPPVTDTAGRVWRLSADGHARVPVIHVRPDDPLHAPAMGIAATLADALEGEGEMAEILGGFEGMEPAQAMVVVAHEFIWEVMDLLVERGLVDRPPVLDDAAADTGALSALLVVRVDMADD